MKDDELKNLKKEFKNLRKKLFEQKKAEVLIKYSEIDFSFAFCNSDLAVKFSLDGTHYVLSINSDLKSIGCFVTLNGYLEKYSEIDKDQFMNLVDKFKGFLRFIICVIILGYISLLMILIVHSSVLSRL